LFASSSLRADSANRGWAISFVILASVSLESSFVDFFLLVMVHRDIRSQAIQSDLKHNPILCGLLS